ncbi:hypothetical protein D3C86_1940530 [compost metagenome]
MQRRGLSEEGPEIVLLVDLLLQPRRVVTGEPADDLVDLCLRALLAFRFLDVHGVHLGERHREDPVL